MGGGYPGFKTRILKVLAEDDVYFKLGGASAARQRRPTEISCLFGPILSLRGSVAEKGEMTR